jgi:hypothetical protein
VEQKRFLILHTKNRTQTPHMGLLCLARLIKKAPCGHCVRMALVPRRHWIPDASRDQAYSLALPRRLQCPKVPVWKLLDAPHAARVCCLSCEAIKSAESPCALP